MFRASDTDSRSALIDIVSHLRSYGTNMIYNNITSLIELPKCESNVLTKTFGYLNTNYTAIKRKRVKLYSDLYDSDNSSDSVADNIMDAKPNIKDEHETPLQDRIVCHKSMKHLSELLDTLSNMDSYLNANENKWSECCPARSELSPGLSDEPACWDEENWWQHQYRHDMLAYIEVESLKKTNLKLQHMQEETCPSKELMELLSLPVKTDGNHLMVAEQSIEEARYGNNVV